MSLISSCASDVFGVSQLALTAQGIACLNSYHPWMSAIFVSMYWGAQQDVDPLEKHGRASVF